jgi:hypothetical protein
MNEYNTSPTQLNSPTRSTHPLYVLLPLLSLHNESLSPPSLSFSSTDSLYNRQGMSHNRKTNPTPNRQTTVTNPHATTLIRQTTSEKAAFESDTRELHNIPRDAQYPS